MRELGAFMADAARLAMDHYAGMRDTNMHGIPYFFAKLDGDESVAWHSEWDFGDATGRYLGALSVCREMTGFSGYANVEEELLDALEWMQGPRGLSYRMADEEWVHYGANMFDQRSVLYALAELERRGNPRARSLGDALVNGLSEIAVRWDDYAFFPFQDYVPDMVYPAQPFNGEGFCVDPAHYGGGTLIQPLTLWSQLTGSEAALKLAGELARFFRFHSRAFEEDGSFFSRARYPDDGHFHSKMDAVAGVIRYGLEVRDMGFAEWGAKVYRWARSMGTPTGWFPEGTGLNGKEPVKPEYEWIRGAVRHSEICCAADMIGCALLLAENGVYDTWGDAIGYANHLLQSQIRKVDFARALDKPDTGTHTWKDIPARYLGGFVGRNQPNDLTNRGAIDTMACCCAAGVQGLFSVWSAAVREMGDLTVVQYLISRTARTVRIESEMPDRGEVRIEMLAPARLRVRRPRWMAHIEAFDGETAIHPIEDGAYLDFGILGAGRQLTLRFPVSDRSEACTVGGDTFTFTWRGDAAVAVSPDGPHMPLYKDN